MRWVALGTTLILFSNYYGTHYSLRSIILVIEMDVVVFTIDVFALSWKQTARCSDLSNVSGSGIDLGNEVSLLGRNQNGDITGFLCFSRLIPLPFYGRLFLRLMLGLLVNFNPLDPLAIHTF